MPKVRPGEREPIATVTVRIPGHVYQAVRELAIRHDVTIGEAFDLWLDKVRIEIEDRMKEEVEQWKKKYEETKAKLEKLEKELKDLERALEGTATKQTKRTRRKSK